MKSFLAIIFILCSLAPISADMVPPKKPKGEPPHPGWGWDGYEWVEPKGEPPQPGWIWDGWEWVAPEPDSKLVVVGIALSLATASLAYRFRKQANPQPA